ncbi:pyridoxal phosphate-dependent aminotransferase [Micromonospora sp. NPDC126480]|uniref:pyridoxal phosphate-dependent aminotransferase n=1 Tax=Micromonospora sp. NPDC126480 TaxID=3155312 RepID=UPI00333181AF
MQLFASPSPPRVFDVPDAVHQAAHATSAASTGPDRFESFVDERMLEVYARAQNPDDPMELRDLWLGRVDQELGKHGDRTWQADKWRSSAVRRQVGAEDVLRSRATVRFVKELFNWYFRDELYGRLRDQAEIILSGGAVDEEAWGVPSALKDCIRYALDRDWYGYSDSRGREPSREAVARYENSRIETEPYTAGNIALTLGGTFAMSSLADFLLHEAKTNAPALCATPNYPPLVETIARRGAIELVPLASEDGRTSLEPLIAALRPDTPLIMLQTVGNPTGAAVLEADLARLIDAAGPSTMILLDECHEWLGPLRRADAKRAAPNVIRISSLSKNWSAPGLKIGWIVADERLVADYYEYASTTFGGPPSFLYTLVEVLARMERWVVEGVDILTGEHAGEFESTYAMDLRGLQQAYDGYRQERRERADGLMLLRDAAVGGLCHPAMTVTPPRYSINMAVEFRGWDDSYLCFRDVLRNTGVSVLPGILTFCLSKSIMRVTAARRWDILDEGMRRLTRYLDQRSHGSLVIPAQRAGS